MTESARLETQRELGESFCTLFPDFPSENVHFMPSIEDTVKLVLSLQSGSRHVNALVSGSLHLVGGIIEVAGLADVAFRSD